MTQKELRKALFREFINNGRYKHTVKLAYRIIWLMEEKKMSEIEVRKKLGLNSRSYDRHIVRLYHMRKGYLMNELNLMNA
jgi:hypothetical protein